MSFKVLIPQDITDPGKDYLKEHGCEIEILDDYSVENICTSFSGNRKNIPVATAIIPTENIMEYFRISLFL